MGCFQCGLLPCPSPCVLAVIPSIGGVADLPSGGTRAHHRAHAVTHLDPLCTTRSAQSPGLHLHMVGRPAVNVRPTPAICQNSAHLSQGCRSTKAAVEPPLPVTTIKSQFCLQSCSILGMDSGLSPTSAQEPCTSDCAPL